MKNNSLSSQLWGVLKRDHSVVLRVTCVVLGHDILPWFCKTWWRFFFFFQIKRYTAFKSMMSCNLRKFWNCVLVKSSNHQEHKRTSQTSREFAWGSVMGLKTCSYTMKSFWRRLAGANMEGESWFIYLWGTEKGGSSFVSVLQVKKNLAWEEYLKIILTNRARKDPFISLLPPEGLQIILSSNLPAADYFTWLFLLGCAFYLISLMNNSDVLISPFEKCVYFIALVRQLFGVILPVGLSTKPIKKNIPIRRLSLHSYTPVHITCILRTTISSQKKSILPWAMLNFPLLKVSLIYIEKFKTSPCNFASRADSHDFSLFDYKLLKQCNLKTIQ